MQVSLAPTPFSPSVSSSIGDALRFLFCQPSQKRRDDIVVADMKVHMVADNKKTMTITWKSNPEKVLVMGVGL